MTDILLQVLLVVAIAAIVLLIVVLWKWNGVLDDVKETTTIAKKRAHEVDDWLNKAEATIKDFTNSFKSFLNTFEQLKNIKNKMADFFESDKPKPEEIKKIDAKTD